MELELTLDDLHSMEMIQLRQEHGNTPDPDSWRWSPFDIRAFNGMLNVAYQYFQDTDNHGPEPISFAEAGSGIGTKLYLAKYRYNMTEYGYERFDYYIEKAKKLGVQCEQRDLSDFDNQPIWEAYDIVYIARPFKDDVKEQAWEHLVQDRMRPGAILMSTFSARKPYDWLCLYRATFRGVWVKPGAAMRTPADQASAIKAG